MDPSAPSQAEREASRWIARLDAEDVSLDDHQRFRVWLAASEDNERAYRALSRTWDALDALKFDPALPARPLATSVTKPVNRRRLLIAGAGALAAGVAGGAVYLSTASPSLAASYQTPIGGRRRIRLEDGSELELNAAAALDVTLTKGLRHIDLRRGEAYFDVAEDPRRFDVKTPFGNFSGRGRFLIKLLADGARASVLDGEVRAQPPGPLALFERASLATNQEIVLAPTPSTSMDLTPSQAHNRGAWRQGLLVFDGETLSEAVLDIQRQTGQRFTFSDPGLADLRIGGQIAANDKDGFIALLRENLSIHARAEGELIVLSR